MYHSLRYLLHDVRRQGASFPPPSFQNLSSFSSSVHCNSIWFSSCEKKNSSPSSFSICEHFQLYLTLCPTVLFEVDFASKCNIAFSLMLATTFKTIHSSLVFLHCPSLPPLLLCLFPPRSSLAAFLHCNQEALSATSAQSIPVSPFLS